MFYRFLNDLNGSERHLPRRLVHKLDCFEVTLLVKHSRFLLYPSLPFLSLDYEFFVLIGAAGTLVNATDTNPSQLVNQLSQGQGHSKTFPF